MCELDKLCIKGDIESIKKYKKILNILSLIT